MRSALGVLPHNVADRVARAPVGPLVTVVVCVVAALATAIPVSDVAAPSEAMMGPVNPMIRLAVSQPMQEGERRSRKDDERVPVAIVEAAMSPVAAGVPEGVGMGRGDVEIGHVVRIAVPVRVRAGDRVDGGSAVTSIIPTVFFAPGLRGFVEFGLEFGIVFEGLCPLRALVLIRSSDIGCKLSELGSHRHRIPLERFSKGHCQVQVLGEHAQCCRRIDQVFECVRELGVEAVEDIIQGRVGFALELMDANDRVPGILRCSQRRSANLGRMRRDGLLEVASHARRHHCVDEFRVTDQLPEIVPGRFRLVVQDLLEGSTGPGSNALDLDHQIGPRAHSEHGIADRRFVACQRLHGLARGAVADDPVQALGGLGAAGEEDAGKQGQGPSLAGPENRSKGTRTRWRHGRS